jgi:diketogulonate reductase-like aldo/keto reductase
MGVTEFCGKKVTPIGVGTWKMGGGDSPDPRHDTRDLASLRMALDRGVNVIDTAEMYGNGHSEEIVREAIRGYPRDDLVIVSKVLPSHLTEPLLRKSLEHSLKRLGTHYLDLYLIHWPPADLNLVDGALRTMEQLVAEGKIRSIGVSNFDVEELQRAQDALRREPLVANQIEYSLLDRSAEKQVIPYCDKHNIIVMAYTPLADGKVARLPQVEEVAHRTGHTPIQVALSYLTRHSIPIPKASQPKHMEEILGTLGWELSTRDWRAL